MQTRWPSYRVLLTLRSFRRCADQGSTFSYIANRSACCFDGCPRLTFVLLFFCAHVLLMQTLRSFVFPRRPQYAAFIGITLSYSYPQIAHRFRQQGEQGKNKFLLWRGNVGGICAEISSDTLAKKVGLCRQENKFAIIKFYLYYCD